MKLFSPAYYGDFKCLAEKCRHSCCIGWEISVDSDTLNRYRSMDADGDKILSFIETEGDFGVIRLNSDGRCPFLSGCGLCSIISSHGEEFVSDICHRHPRFYHRIKGVCEVGIGAVCEEAARLILTSDDLSMCSVAEECTEWADETDFDTVPLREDVLSVLKSSASYSEKFSELSGRYFLANKLYDDKGWDEVTSELELLDDCDREIFALSGEPLGAFGKYSERFLYYLVFRHCSIASDYDNFRARLGFCLLMSRFFESSVSRLASFSEEGCVDVARRLSEEIEYSEDNTDTLIFEFESTL